MVALKWRRLHAVDNGTQEHARLLEIGVLSARIRQLNGLGDRQSWPDQKPTLLQDLPGNRLLRSLVYLHSSTGQEEAQWGRDDSELAHVILDDRVSARAHDVALAGHAFPEHWHVIPVLHLHCSFKLPNLCLACSFPLKVPPSNPVGKRTPYPCGTTSTPTQRVRRTPHPQPAPTQHVRVGHRRAHVPVTDAWFAG